MGPPLATTLKFYQPANQIFAVPRRDARRGRRDRLQNMRRNEMSEELKPNDEAIFAWWDNEYDVGCYNKHGDERYTPKVARKYVPADLLPVVKPLEWKALHGGGFRAVCPVIGLVHVVEDSSGRWFCFNSKNKIFGIEGFSREGFGSETEAKITFSKWRETRIRACLDMIDPAALVAGAYEAAIRACINMDLLTDHPNDAGSVVLRALTPADAQDALDAAIAKAVNAKLDAVATRSVEWAMKNPDEDMILNVFAEEILAMKEEG
jgi:hypothetical protein